MGGRHAATTAVINAGSLMFSDLQMGFISVGLLLTYTCIC